VAGRSASESGSTWPQHERERLGNSAHGAGEASFPFACRGSAGCGGTRRTRGRRKEPLGRAGAEHFGTLYSAPVGAAGPLLRYAPTLWTRSGDRLPLVTPRSPGCAGGGAHLVRYLRAGIWALCRLYSCRSGGKGLRSRTEVLRQGLCQRGAASLFARASVSRGAIPRVFPHPKRSPRRCPIRSRS